MSEVVPQDSPEDTEACTRLSDDDGVAAQPADLPSCLEDLDEDGGELPMEAVRLEQKLERIGTTHGIPLVGLSGLSRLKPPAWLVDRLIPEKSLVFVYGEPGSGKTFLLTDLARCVATRAPWNGREVLHGPVLFVAGEGFHGTGKRLVVAREHFGFPETAPILLVPQPVPLDDKHQMMALSNLALNIGTVYGPPVRAVIVDTFHACLAGADENSAKEMGAVLSNCRRLIEATGAAVIIAHHSGKDGSRAPRAFLVRPIRW